MSRSAERIVSLLWLLLEAGANGRTKAEIYSYLYDQQATTPAAKQRQFTRDKAALTAIGVPIQWRPQPHAEDVYLIDQDRLYLPEVALSDDEILALHQARALWLRTPLEQAIHSALARMTAQQPTRHPVVGAQLATDQTLLTQLVAAAREQQPISFRYRTAENDDITTRRLRPWAVLMANQQWYTTGWDLDRHAQRLFKLTRIESNTITPLQAETLTDQENDSHRPEDFDIEIIRTRLHTEQAPDDAYVWVHQNAATNLRVRATTLETQDSWELIHFTYHDPHKTAASIAALTTHATVDSRSPASLSQMVTDILVRVNQTHQPRDTNYTPELRKVTRSRRRAGDKDVIARRLGIVAVVNQHGGVMSRAALRQRFQIDDTTLTQDLRAMQFWGMPETDFAGGQFELDPHADPVTIRNAELLAQPWQLSAPEALGLISGLAAVATIPGISASQLQAAQSLENKLRDAVATVTPQVGHDTTIVHPDLSLGADDAVAKIMHQAAQQHKVVNITYYSASSGTITKRTIEPLQLLYATGNAYVRAWCQHSASLRTFRIDRIGTAQITGTGFDPALRQRLDETNITPAIHTGAQLTAVVHATHRYRDIFDAYHPDATATMPDGSLYAQLNFRSMTPLLELLTNHPGQVTVIEPSQLRETISQKAQRALESNPQVIR